MNVYKTIDLQTFKARLIAQRDRVIFSVAWWNTHKSLDHDVFGIFANSEVFKSVNFPGTCSDEETRVAFFSIPPSAGLDAIERVARFGSVRLFVCAPTVVFPSNFPGALGELISARDEITECQIEAASTMEGIDWIALREGDEGDAYYLLFEGADVVTQ